MSAPVIRVASMNGEAPRGSLRIGSSALPLILGPRAIVLPRRLRSQAFRTSRIILLKSRQDRIVIG
jgi:hypothetical protein